MPAASRSCGPHVQLHVAEPVDAGDPGADRARRHHRAGQLHDARAPRPRWRARGRRAARPAARCAAAGAKTSRPWNVCDTGCRTMASDVISTAASAPPSASHAMDSTPLSGPTRSAPEAARTAIGPPARAHARIDDRHVDRVVGHVRGRAAERQPAAHHVLPGDGVREVHDPGVRRDPEHHPVTDADELVGRAVVGAGRRSAGSCDGHVLLEPAGDEGADVLALVPLEEVGAVVGRREDLDALGLDRLVVERLRRGGRVAVDVARDEQLRRGRRPAGRRARR